MGGIKSKIKHSLKWILLAVLVVAVLITGVILYLQGNLFAELLPKDKTSFLFLDVGQANCAVITSPDGNAMIDTGSGESAERMLAALSYYGIKRIDLLILTHADEDHTGGLRRLSEEIPIGCLWMSMVTERALEPLYGDLFGDVIPVESVAGGDRTMLGDLLFEILSPSLHDLKKEDGTNESSLIIHVADGEINAIFPGDADMDGEMKALYALNYRYSKFRCELLLVGHHGSKYSSGERFLFGLSPQYAVISCRLYNTYEHPDPSVLKRLERFGATVARTDLEGTIIFVSDGKTLTRLR
jgi:competence protein ComEC